MCWAAISVACWLILSYSAGELQSRLECGALRSEAHLEDGELNGDCIWYRQTGGLLQKGGFLSGDKHGRWQRWTKSGVPIDEGTFDRGVKSGLWTYYNPDGSIKKTTKHRGPS